MTKRKFILFSLTLILTIFTTGCNNNYEEESMMVQEVLIPMDKFEYSHAMYFEMQIIINGERHVSPAGWVFFRLLVGSASQEFDPFFDELIFVHNEEEAQGFPDNVIVAWPRDGQWTQDLINGIHWSIENPLLNLHGRPVREPVTLEDFGLVYPLTAADLVDNWEKVNELWNAFDRTEQTFMRFAAPVGNPSD